MIFKCSQCTHKYFSESHSTDFTDWQRLQMYQSTYELFIYAVGTIP